jgi:hypothetical protein
MWDTSRQSELFDDGRSLCSGFNRHDHNPDLNVNPVEMVDLITGSSLLSFSVDFLNYKFTRGSEYL